LVRQRTQCLNALRGHLAEYGYAVAQGITHADAVIAHVEQMLPGVVQIRVTRAAELTLPGRMMAA
jgi:hypothetical protein